LEALAQLDQFLKRFPNHPFAEKVREKRKALEKSLSAGTNCIQVTRAAPCLTTKHLRSQTFAYRFLAAAPCKFPPLIS